MVSRGEQTNFFFFSRETTRKMTADFSTETMFAIGNCSGFFKVLKEKLPTLEFYSW